MNNGWFFLLNSRLDTLPQSVTEARDILSGDGYFAARTTSGKFMNDRVFLDTPDCLVIVDGIVVNNHELMNELGCGSWPETVLSMAKGDASGFFMRFRGSFNGLLYLKREKKAIAFVDHSGTKNLYYSNVGGELVVSSDYRCILDMMAENGIERRISRRATRQMLTYGYMLDGSTFVENVCRTEPGNLIESQSGAWVEKPYFRFDNTHALKRTDEEWIELLDAAFRRSVKLEFDKDLEYGYTPVVDISGGLDSRMVAWVSHEMGYNNILGVSYSQSRSWDSRVAKKVAAKTCRKFVFRPLDNADFLMSPEEVVLKNFGQNYYGSITGGEKLLSSLDFSGLGIEHTGLLGDMEEGSFALVPYQRPAGECERYRFSHIFDYKMDPKLYEPFANEEICWYYIRGLIAGFGTNPIRQAYTETYGPFIDVDFQNLFFSIPIELRMGGIFKRWMIAKYPEAAKIPYARYRCRITRSPFTIKTIARIGYLEGYAAQALRKLGIKVVRAADMNPFAYWYDTKPELRAFLHDYIERGIETLEDGSELKGELTDIQNKGNVMDKLIGVTILCAKNHYTD